jgi:uncharacterized protein YndB with AHSA1/START domain
MQSEIPTDTLQRATIELLSDTRIRITRSFDAPRRKVFAAMTIPEHVRRWYGPSVLAFIVCEIDLRVGGRWRNVLRAPDGTEHGFSGEYIEIVAPELIRSTECYEAIGPDHAFEATVRLEEIRGVTVFTNTIQYKCREDRDGHLSAGMEAGMNESFDRLVVLLTTIG